MAEQYSFDVAYITHPESMLMGKEAEILLLPTLKVNDRKCNLNIMKNTKVTLTTISFIDNLPITKTYDNLSPNSQNEISIKFQVPPNLQSVSIQIETEVMNISKGKTEQLTHSHQIGMTTKNETLNFYDCHLRKYKGEYYFYVLGKNGEPLVDVNVMFTFSHQIYNQKQESASFNTDNEGKVFEICPLTDIIRIYGSFNGPNGYSNHDYKIETHKERVSLPGALNILEDEQIELPFVCNSGFSEQTCSLIRYADNIATNNRSLSNWFNKIAYTHEGDYQYGKIGISGLERGYYQLSYNTTGQTISIRVHKGVYWETDSFILKDHSLVEKRDTTNLVRIKNVYLEEQKEGGSKLKFGLSGYSNLNRTRAHVVAFTFEPSDPGFMYDSLNKVTKDWAQLDIFPFAKWQNIFLSNRKLSDEFRYVFDRKIMTKLMGGDSARNNFLANNTLEKPQLLLNRHKIRDTQFDQEISNQGEAYQATEEAKMLKVSNIAPMMEQQNERNYSLQRQNVVSRNRVQMASSSITNQYMPYCPPNFGNLIYKSFQNFLDNSACIISNLIPDENGDIECSLDTQNYSAFAILAVDENTVTQVTLDIDEAKSTISKRDLSLSTPLNPSKHYNETRNTIVVKANLSLKNHQIEDITSSDYFLVDSLERVKQIQTEIQFLMGYSVMNDLDFVTKWPTYTEEDKNKKYSKFMSHELNLFLYLKDREYFDKVVKPFISNKMEKSFIDNWLLGEHDCLMKYTELEHFDKLNTLEKCLLIAAIVNTDKQTATILAKKIKLKTEVNAHQTQTKNRIFDAVINLNMMQDKPTLIGEGGMVEWDDDEIMISEESYSREMKKEIGGGGGIMSSMVNFLAGARGNKKSKKRPMAQQLGRAGGKTHGSLTQNYNEENSSDDEYDRERTRTQFQQTETAVEYAETQYYRNYLIHNPSFVNENEFWLDFANYILENGSIEGFVSSNFIYSIMNHT